MTDRKPEKQQALRLVVAALVTTAIITAILTIGEAREANDRLVAWLTGLTAALGALYMIWSIGRDAPNIQSISTAGDVRPSELLGLLIGAGSLAALYAVAEGNQFLLEAIGWVLLTSLAVAICLGLFGALKDLAQNVTSWWRSPPASRRPTSYLGLAKGLGAWAILLVLLLPFFWLERHVSGLAVGVLEPILGPPPTGPFGDLLRHSPWRIVGWSSISVVGWFAGLVVYVGILSAVLGTARFARRQWRKHRKLYLLALGTLASFAFFGTNGLLLAIAFLLIHLITRGTRGATPSA